MKKIVAFFALLTMAYHGSAVVYLKAGAMGAGDGSSWANAYTDIHAAVADAAASGEPLYIAKGVYTLTSHIYVGNSPISIYGSFLGESESETIEGRNLTDNRTILSGDTTHDHNWVHLEPANYSLVHTELPESPLWIDGAFQMPPAFTGDYDGYCISQVKSEDPSICDSAFIFDKNVSLLDGITFVAFRGSASSGGAASGNRTRYAVVNTYETDTHEIRNCAFLGNIAAYGAVYFHKGGIVKNTDVMYAYSTTRASGFTVHGGSKRVLVEDCHLVSCNRENVQGSGHLFNGWSGAGFDVYDTVVERSSLLQGSGYNGNYHGPGHIYAAEGGGVATFTGCTFKNLLSGGSDSRPTFLASPGGGTLVFTKCLFEGNRQNVKPVAGSCYPMFGAYSDEKKIYFDGCTFKENVIAAPEVAAKTGSYVLTIMGNYANNTYFALANCTFDNNCAEAVEVPGVTPFLCRGVATINNFEGAKNQIGLANCTFLGENNGQYDIAQIGVKHSQPINIVNCLFMADGENAANPIYADVPPLVNLQSSTVQNQFAVDSGFIVAGYETDKVPFEVAVSDGNGYVLRPSAKTPGLQSGLFVARNGNVNASGIPMGWVFKEEGVATWKGLAPAMNAASATTDAMAIPMLIDDATGAVRSQESFTRGAVQNLTSTAATGASLVLRREPFAAGAFTPALSAQSVESGAFITPVTAVPVSSSLAFDGWYDEDDTLVSSDATLSMASLTGDMTVLTAKFTTPNVGLTFSLGGKGVFTENNLDTITIYVPMHSQFPAVPSYILNAGELITGWNTPSIVPETDSAYTAQIVSTDTRIVYVVPTTEAPIVQDGTSWETAYTNLYAAYQAAAQYKGEVWMKRGRYLMTEELTLKSNVRIIGGFDGTESEASDANPDLNPTIITGDKNDDNYWRRDGTSLASHKIWNWETLSYMPPNPDGTDTLWTITRNSTDDTVVGFSSTSGVATNCVFTGLTFTCFGKNVFDISSGSNEGFKIENCRFISCSTLDKQNSTHDATLKVKNVNATIENCLFDNCARGITLSSSSATRTTIKGCTFKNGITTASGSQIRTANVNANDNASAGNFAYVDIIDCHFFRNYNDSSSAGAACIYFFGPGGTTYNNIVNTTFEENRPWNTCCATVYIYSGNHIFDNCRFIGNNKAPSSGSLMSTAGIFSQGGFTEVRNCYFTGNRIEAPAGSTRRYGSVYAQSSGGTTYFINSTIVANEAINNSASATVGTMNFTGNNFRFGLIHSTISQSIFEGANTADLIENETSVNQRLGIVNSIIHGEGADYMPLMYNNKTVPTIAGSFISNFDKVSLAPLSTMGFIIGVENTVPTLFPVKEGKNGVKVQTVKSYDFIGLPLAYYNQRYYVLNNKSETKPWQCVSENSQLASQYVDPVTHPSDAFGAERKQGKIKPGPMNAPSRVTFLQVN